MRVSEAAGDTAEGVWEEMPLYPTLDLMKPQNLNPENLTSSSRESEGDRGGWWLCR